MLYNLTTEISVVYLCRCGMAEWIAQARVRHRKCVGVFWENSYLVLLQIMPEPSVNPIRVRSRGMPRGPGPPLFSECVYKLIISAFSTVQRKHEVTLEYCFEKCSCDISMDHHYSIGIFFLENLPLGEPDSQMSCLNVAPARSASTSVVQEQVPSSHD